MNLPAGLPSRKAETLHRINGLLCRVPNVVGVVLGGSHANGLAGPESDLDIGVYYRQARPFSIQEIRSVAESLSAAGALPIVTELYGWGEWVNGGAWIETPTGQVDFLYRNLDQVQSVIEEGSRGMCRHDFDQQPPFGFRSVVYFGETHICIPLHDPDNEIARLKQSVAKYPGAMRDRIVQDYLWAVEFSLMFCRRFANTRDVVNAVGCMTRIGQYLVHVLFALNEIYFVNDKNASRILESFALRPRDFTARLANVLSSAGGSPRELLNSTDLLTALWRETVALTGGAYKPRFEL